MGSAVTITPDTAPNQVTITPDAPAKKPETGVWAGVKRNTIGMVQGLYDAFAEPPTPEEAAAVATAKANPNLALAPDHLVLALHRMFVDPSIQTAEQAKNLGKKAEESAKSGHYAAAGSQGIDAAVTGSLAAIPGLGPWINSVANRATGIGTSGSKEREADPTGAAVDVLAAKALSKIPSVVKGTRQALSNAIFEPGSTEFNAWGDAIAHPSKLPETLLKKTLPPSDQPIYPGAQYPSAEDFYEKTGAERAKVFEREARAAKQAAAGIRLAAKNAPQPSPFEGMTSSANPPDTGVKLPVSSAPAEQPNVALVSKFQQPSPSKIVLPGSEPPPVKVTYQSVPREQLYDMAKRGNINAGLELIRNPKGFNLPPNFKYLIEETAKRIPWRNAEQ